MPRTQSQSRRPAGSDVSPEGPASWPLWLTRAAFVLAAALVLARATMMETLRNPLDVNPGAEAIPRGPGSGTGLVLDMLCCAAALLVLARRALDPAYALRFAWSFVPLALLAVWTVASTLWAGDRFAAAVSGTHWLCAAVLLWSLAQLVRDWAHFRLVVAFGAGLLLVQVGQGLYYRYVEHPDLVESWNVQREEIIRQRGWDPDSFIAGQFERRVLSGEMMGFTSSPNSFGAVLVLLTLVAAGAAIQRFADRDEPAWAAAPAGAAALGLLVIVFVNSRTSMATPVLGAALLAGVWMFRGLLARRARLAYAGGVCAVLAIAAAVVGHGLHHGTLFHASLTFRWRYWVAGARLFAEHPLFGVGWENFGPHYLAVRLPIAAEEIKDPHNFLVRFATETGAVGLALCLAWLLLLWWDLTQPWDAEGPAPSPGSPGEGGGEGPRDSALGTQSSALPGTLTPTLSRSTGRGGTEAAPLAVLAAVGVLGITINLLASIDWSQAGAYNALEVMRRLGFVCLFIVGAALTALRSAHDQGADERPAPWMLYATLVGLGLFFLHNLVDFSLFEPGPMFLFALLCGAGLGVRTAGRTRARRLPAGATWGILAAAVLVWIFGLGLAARVVKAEGEADFGDEALRRFNARTAALHFERAMNLVPYNADYAFRAARAQMADPRATEEVGWAVSLLTDAIDLDPNRPQYYLHRAYARLRLPNPDVAGVRADYEQALRLDPNNVDVRLEYAEILRRFGDEAGAVRQYREALRYNDLLAPDEVKRLPPQKVEEVKRTIDGTEG